MLLCHSSLVASIYKEYCMCRFILLGCFALAVSACSNFQFSSNLDKKNFVEYFKPSQVTVYEKSDLRALEYKVLGAVEGSSCQAEINDRPADIKEARTNARINAAALKANGIVFQSCLSFEQDQACITNIICYGRALVVTSPDAE
jgi:RcsF protein